MAYTFLCNNKKPADTIYRFSCQLLGFDRNYFLVLVKTTPRANPVWNNQFMTLRTFYQGGGLQVNIGRPALPASLFR